MPLQCDAYGMWADVEAEAGEKLITTTGGVNLAPTESDNLRQLARACDAAGVRYSILDSAQASREYGLRLPKTHSVLVQDETGSVNASKTVATFQLLAERHGAALRDHAEVVECADAKLPDGRTGARLTLACGTTLLAASVVVAPGAWARPLFNKLAGFDINLQVMQCSVMYFAANEAFDRRRRTGSPREPTKSAKQLLADLPALIDYGETRAWGSDCTCTLAALALRCRASLQWHLLHSVLKRSLYAWLFKFRPLTDDMCVCSKDPCGF